MVHAVQVGTSRHDRRRALRSTVCRRKVPVLDLRQRRLSTIRPPVRRRGDEAAGLADIYCERCVPPWSILEVDASSQPWKLMAGQAFACPGCRRSTKYMIRPAPWRPIYVPRPEF
jgi:hypothetical protein